MPAPVVIVGAGLAGYTVAREIRKRDRQLPLVVIAADDGHFYSKPMLSNAVMSNKSADELVIKSAAQMRTDLDCEILTCSAVSAIAAADHTVTVDGCTLGYGKLVLALGADPIQLPFAGTHSVNDLADYRHFRSRIAGKERIAILGAGLIGCEFANDLRSGGYDVDVIDLGDGPLRRFLPLECSNALRAALAGIGVKWHFGAGVASIAEVNGSMRAVLGNGVAIDADTILSAVGLKPRTGLAKDAGIRTGVGIVTDRFLRTSAADVYALGDCAEIGGLSLPFVLPIMQAARALAATLTGDETAVSYPPMPIVVKTPQCPVVIAPPPPLLEGAWEVGGDAAGVKAVYRDQAGAVRGFALVGAAAGEKNALVKAMPMLLS